MIEALDRVMPTFDPDIAKLAPALIDGRDIDARSGVLAKSIKPGAPVQIELVDMQTREPVETLEVDAVLVTTGQLPSSKDLNPRPGIEPTRASYPSTTACGAGERSTRAPSVGRG